MLPGANAQAKVTQESLASCGTALSCYDLTILAGYVMEIAELQAKLRRQAVIMQIGGARPSDDLAASWFGKVNLALPGEAWPLFNEQPMLPLSQINIKALPVIPDILADLEFVTVFIEPGELPLDTPNGEGWCLRSYRELSKLVPLEMPGDLESNIKPFPLFAQLRDDDYPCHEDCDIELPEEVDENYYDYFQGLDGFKIGGWPRLIQSDIFWAPYNKHDAKPEFAFQIDSSDKAQWAWGDGGIGYFGRGTAPGHEDEWALTWQCF